METKSIMIVGVGGQGSLLASRIIGNVLLSQGFDVKVSEVHGMSQRGGSVVTYVKYGDKVYSPVIEKGEADIIVSFELLEAARWISYLKKGGHLITSTQTLDPMPVITGAAKYPENIIEKIKKSYRFVDITLGTGAMNSFPSKLYDLLKEKKKNIEFVEVTNEIEEEVPIKYDSKYKASVSIIYGCNNFCSYCIVPYVRGRERSRRPEDILNDVRKLAKEGYKEIMLLGQNVNSYGNDFKDTNYSFPNLLQDIEKIDGIEIIRFMSPHPKDFSDELIDVIKSSKKIARQIHLPLQSGSSKILKEMNRKHTKEDNLKIVNKLKNADENISISTDIIVGFPGETEEDFLDTLDVVKKVKFDQIYMFIYSKRVGTRAEKMEDNTPEEEKVRRLERIKEIYEEYLPENNKKMIGKTYKVLVEGVSKNNDKLLTGRTSQNKVVIFDGDKSNIGKIVNVEILSEHLWYLKGKIV